MRGLTLPETLLALLIAALVSAYAIPTYQEHRARGYRQAVVQAMYACALQWEEERGTFPDHVAGFDAASRGGGGKGMCAAPSAPYRLVARDTDAGANLGGQRDAPGYVIEATPLPQGPLRDDRCGAFTLDSAGRRGNRRAGGSGDGAFAGCWSGSRR